MPLSEFDRPVALFRGPRSAKQVRNVVASFTLYS